MSTEKQPTTNVVDLTSPLTIYNATEAAIADLKATYLNLKIAGLDDKDGYEAARKGLRTLVGLRNKVDKHRLDLKRQIDNGAKILLAELAPIEANLKTEVDKIDAEVERIKLEKAEAARLEFVKRTNYLFNLGFTFNGTLYVLGKYAFAPSTLQEMDDMAFATLMDVVEPYAKNLAANKAAEEARLKAVEEENERLRKELEAKNAVEANLETLKKQGAITSGQVDSVQVEGDTTTVNTSVQFPKPAQTVKIPVSFKDEVSVTDEKSAAEDNRLLKDIVAKEYAKGFNTCKAKIIEILHDPAPTTRKALLERINNLKP